MNESKSLAPIQFHGDTIYVVEYQGQPFTPMKPIVENLGLKWETQSVKIRNNRERWATVPLMGGGSKDGKNREMICIPVRKLPGFLATINPLKVANKLRSKIVQYQNECDDALWDYWTKGQAENPRSKPGLTPEQQDKIRKLVFNKINAYHSQDIAKSYASVYGSIKREFNVTTYKNIPTDKFDELVRFIKTSPAPAGTLPLKTKPAESTADNFIRYINSKCDSILNDLDKLDHASLTTKNITVHLMQISSALGAMYPKETKLLMFSDNDFPVAERRIS